MFGDLMNKLKDAQQAMEQSKKQLDNVLVDADVENGKVKVTANGNRKITNLSIDDELIASGDRETIEDLVMLAINRALEKAEKLSESEMQRTAMDFMPNLQGLL